MSLIASWQGDVQTSSAKVGVLATVDGVLTARLNGTTYTGDTIAQASTGGWGAVNITGLTPDSSYTVDLFVGGLPVGSRRIVTQKTRGDLNFLWLFCSGPPHRDAVIKTVLQRLAARGVVPDAAFWLGDWIYHSNVRPVFGVDVVDIEGGTKADATNVGEAFKDSSIWFRKPDSKLLMDTCPVLFFPDDHEFLDNYNDDLTQMSDPGRSKPLPWVVTAQDYYDAWDAQVQAVDAVQCANPAKDAYRLTVFDYGPCHFVMPFCVEKYKSLDAAGHFISVEQMASFKAALSGAGVDQPFIPILSSKSIVAGNGDSWYDQIDSYDGSQGDLLELLDYIEANQISTVGWGFGDLHRQVVIYSSNPRGLSEQTPFSAMLGVGPGSTSQTQVLLTQTEHILLNQAGFGVGVIHVPADRSYIEYRIEGERSTVRTVRQLPGSNRMVYPRMGGGTELATLTDNASGDPSLILEVPTITEADSYTVAVSSLPGGDFPLDYGSFEGTLAVSGTFSNTTGRVIFSVTNNINNGLQIKTTTNAEQIGYILRNFDNNPSAQDYSGNGTETGYDGVSATFTLRASWDKDNGYFACLKNETTGVILDASDLTGSGNGFASGTDLYVLGANWAGAPNESVTLTNGKFYNEAKGQAWCQEIIA